MDIIVTTPKSAHKLAAEEAKFVEQNPDAYWFRTFRGRPNVQIGDKVYYVDNGQIRGYGIVFDIDFGELMCESAGRFYNGIHLKQRKWVWLKKPIPFKGFQGFRYVNRLPELQKKLGVVSIE
uniref:Uncharacterized protein n=1 Tax=viral metagenome TaxID=1070528 RepID=A0A6M3KZ09_9ZZZZ